MPTLSPDQQPHRHRDVAESFGADPERYDRARPRYPQALIDRIAAPGLDLLDVGVGTGIAARQFTAAGCRVLGVDADPRMAAWARRSGLPVEVSAFESWDPAGRSFDAVVSAQTWHWIDPAAGARKAAEILRPGGRLAVCWNAGLPPADLAAAFADVYRRHLPDSLTARWAAASATTTAPSAASAALAAGTSPPVPAGATASAGTTGVPAATTSTATTAAPVTTAAPAGDPGDPGASSYAPLGDRAADGIRGTGAFTEPERWLDTWTRTYTCDEWLDLLPTQGGHGPMPAAVAEALAALITEPFPVRYTTLTVTALRLP